MPNVIELAAKRETLDPVASMYKRVRDIALFDEDVPRGMRIAVLELVKTELLNGMQSQIDAELEQE